MLDSSRFIDERLDVSITSLNPPSSPIDQTEPLSFQGWLKYNNSLFTNADDFLKRYQSYLNNWYEVKNLNPASQEQRTRELYTALINEIVLTHTTTDERRFLKNVDLNNKRDLAVAVPFFAQKIKEICLYYSTLRDEVKTGEVRYNLKGSNYGIEKLVYNEISKSLETEDLTDIIRTLSLSLSDIRNNLVVEVEDLFDNYPNYLDISPNLPASAYSVTEPTDEQYFNLNQYNIDPLNFIDFNSSIVQAITSYPFLLMELQDDVNFKNLAITPEVNSTQLDLLKDSDYINTINTQNRENLNLNNVIVLTEKFIGTDYYYLSTGNTGTSFITGALFFARNEFANFINKRYPSVAAVPSSEFIKTSREIGLFFKPDKIGITNFTNFGLEAIANTGSLSSNTIYFFPDPAKYGNISGLTKEEFQSPLTFRELNYYSKVDFSNQYRFGDPDTSSYYQTYRPYETREQSLKTSLAGLTKYTDPQEFFNGPLKSKWANEDLFPLVPANVFPISNRIEKLYSLNKTAVQYKNDIYGNEFILYKNIHPPKVPEPDPQAQGNIKFYFCQIIDGHVFYDAISGFNFNYEIQDDDLGYSGIILKSVTNMPPGTGYYTPSLEVYNDGPPSFLYPNLTGGLTPLVSYRMQPESFCPSFIKTEYFCETKDGVTFTTPGSGLLPDTSSDEPSFNPENAIVYYTELLDGGVNPTSINPKFRADFAYPGILTFMPPVSDLTPVDGNFFWVNSAAPCGDVGIFEVKYNEKSNFLNYRIPNRKTTVDYSITGLSYKKTIYDAKYREYGDLYYRNSNSSIIEPASSALVKLVEKYPIEILQEINKKLINFDLYYDTIQFETENYLVFDKLLFDYKTNTINTNTKSDSYFQRGDYKNLEKFSTVWFNEKENNLFFCRTILYNELSATNYKIIYPEIYTLNINSLVFNRIYPTVNKEDLNYFVLSSYSFMGKELSVNIVMIDKPLFTYDTETENYCITYLGKDLSNVFYVFKTFFRYLNGVITNVSNTMFKLNPDVKTINFALPLSSFSTYTVLGSSAGTIMEDNFIFGV